MSAKPPPVTSHHVNVVINDRQYRLACEEGQEPRLLQLAANLETRIQDLRGKFGEIGDARLTVMAALPPPTNCSMPAIGSGRWRKRSRRCARSAVWPPAVPAPPRPRGLPC